MRQYTVAELGHVRQKSRAGGGERKESRAGRSETGGKAELGEMRPDSKAGGTETKEQSWEN